MVRFIIRAVRMAHCKKGPQLCEKCREMDTTSFCLLDIDPPDKGMLQRRVIDVTLDSEQVWREFDVVRVFADKEEALQYSKDHNIENFMM